MTNNDAIYILSGLKRSLNEYCGLNNNGQKAFDMAISALERQIPKVLIAEGDGYADGSMVYDSFYCPSCDHRMEEDEVEDYCPNCGQKISLEGE